MGAGKGREMPKGQTASHTNEFALRVLVAWNLISLKPVNSLQSYLYIQYLTYSLVISICSVYKDVVHQLLESVIGLST